MLEGLRHREVSGERVYIVVKLPDNRIRIAEHLRLPGPRSEMWGAMKGLGD